MGLFVMHIIEIVDYQIVLTEEAMMMRPIRELWNSDRSKNKDKFMQQASVIYNMADPRATYSFIIDEKERLAEIIAQEGLPKDFKVDTKLQAAIDCYKAHTMTSSYQLLKRARIACDKLGKFLEDLDPAATDDKGKLLVQPNTYTNTIKQIPELVAALENAEKLLAKEIEEEGRARGGNVKTVYEDGF